MTVIDSTTYSASISRKKSAQPKCASCMNHIWAITLFGQARFTPARFADYQFWPSPQKLSGPISRDSAIVSLRYPLSRNTFSAIPAIPPQGAIPPLVPCFTQTYQCDTPFKICKHIARYFCDTPGKQARKSFAILSLQVSRDMESIAAGPLSPKVEKIAEIGFAGHFPHFWAIFSLSFFLSGGRNPNMRSPICRNRGPRSLLYQVGKVLSISVVLRRRCCCADYERKTSGQKQKLFPDSHGQQRQKRCHKSITLP